MTAEEWVEEMWGVETVRKMNREEREHILRRLRFVDIQPEVEITENPDGTRTHTIVGSMNGEIYDFVMKL